MKQTFGIIGAGRIGQAVAHHLKKGGYPVLLSNSSGPASLQPLVDGLGKGVKAATVEEAAKADIVLLALPWTELASLTEVADWNGRMVIDATNQFLTHEPEFKVADLGGRPSTSVVADLLPGARLVKAFNTLYFKILAQDPEQAGGRRVIFISGDDEPAKAEVKEVITNIGFAAIDLGGLETGSRLQHPKSALATLNLIQLS